MLSLFGKNKRAESQYQALFKAESRRVADNAKDVYERSRDYHRAAPAGKMEATTTKPLATQDDLSLAYSPGVAGPCLDIAENADLAYEMTNKGNTVAVITNGTAVLGLGNIGALASKPVMEGKAALFKTFAGIDSIDLCVNEKDPEKLAAIVLALAPSFGGINLEDIKAPDCFIVEDICKANADIPIFHDDQHGTATVILAGLLNALELTNRRLADIKIVVSGAGAAAIATLDLLSASGVKKENITLFDSQGVVSKTRKKLEPRRGVYAQGRGAPRSIALALRDADFFLGVSKAGALDPSWLQFMAPKPIIFALANPEPEIWPSHALEVAPEAIVATGRSDFPNQVNNVLCFPFLFRGALDVRAKTITRNMQIAAAKAIASLARTTPGPETIAAYPGDDFTFGPKNILPRPFDKRLGKIVSKAVADAAIKDGVARITPKLTRR